MARILVIEDDLPMASLLREVLEANGHAVSSAFTGTDGVALLQRQVFDLVITDLILPELDGLGVIMYVRRSMVAVPILAISGATSNADLYLTIATKLGANAILAKPFTNDQLIRNVTALLAPPS